MSVWVVNTSPLVFLGSLGRLELLRGEGREVCILLFFQALLHESLKCLCFQALTKNDQKR
jgi:hypothetical protein